MYNRAFNIFSLLEEGELNRRFAIELQVRDIFKIGLTSKAGQYFFNLIVGNEANFEHHIYEALKAIPAAKKVWAASQRSYSEAVAGGVAEHDLPPIDGKYHDLLRKKEIALYWKKIDVPKILNPRLPTSRIQGMGEAESIYESREKLQSIMLKLNKMRVNPQSCSEALIIASKGEVVLDVWQYRLLLKFVNNIDHQDRFGDTSLMCSVAQDKRQWCEILLEAGASTSVSNNKGDTALHFAANKPNDTFVRILAKPGKDVNMPNIMGETPLHVAAYNSRKSCLAALRASGARDDIRDVAGKTVTQIMATI